MLVKKYKIYFLNLNFLKKFKNFLIQTKTVKGFVKMEMIVLITFKKSLIKMNIINRFQKIYKKLNQN